MAKPKKWENQIGHLRYLIDRERRRAATVHLSEKEWAVVDRWRRKLARLNREIFNG
jgi:hypothetical protein